MTSADKYIIITDEEQLKKYLGGLRKKGVRKIALDMEGDQGMFHYKYAVSILQCFDGEEAAVIDVLKMGVNDTLREFLTCPDIDKVMFACGNDVFMSQNVIGCTIAPIRDIYIAQHILGLPTNLTDYLDIDKKQKDRYQRANWLARPIKPALLEYAINDVLQLLEIEESLAAQLAQKRGLYDQYIAASRAASEKVHDTDPHTLFQTKFPGYSRMPFEKRKRAAVLWIFRELLGAKFDCPVGYLMSKKSLAAALENDRGDLAAAVEAEINRSRRQEKHLSYGLIHALLESAKKSPHIPPRPIGTERTGGTGRSPRSRITRRRPKE